MTYMKAKTREIRSPMTPMPTFTKRGVIIPFTREYGSGPAALAVSDLVLRHLPAGAAEIDVFTNIYQAWASDLLYVKLSVKDLEVPWLPVVPEACEYPSMPFDDLRKAIEEAA